MGPAAIMGPRIRGDDDKFSFGIDGTATVLIPLPGERLGEGAWDILTHKPPPV